MSHAVLDIRENMQRMQDDGDIANHAFTSNGESVSALLDSVREQAARDGISFAGTVSPQDAWLLFSTGAARIVDVRTEEERQFVGYVPGTLHVPWMVGTTLKHNPQFSLQLAEQVAKDEIILLLCRSGRRSAQAAEVAAKAGFRRVFNIRQGFEGDLDSEGRRGFSNGWRYQNLPWQQN